MNMPTVELSEVADFVTGGTPSRKVPEYYSGDIPWITGADIVADGAIVSSARSHITPEAVRNSATNVVETGTVLLVTRTSVGKVGVTGVPLAINQDITAVRPDPARLDRNYLVRCLQHQARRFEDRAQGATIQGVNRSVVAETPVPLPPLCEQRRIAAVLDAADALRAKRREALAKLDTLTQSIFMDMFVREDETFEHSPVGDLVAPGKNMIRTGPFGSQLLHEEFTNEGVAVLGIDNAVQNRFAWGERRFITREKYEQLKRYTVRPGDVLITIMGTTGRVAVVPDDIPTAINTKHLCCITLDQARCLPEFLWAALRFHPAVLRDLGATHGAVMPGLNMGKIKSAQVPVPQLEFQQRFVELKRAVEEQELLLLGSADELDNLFASLQQRAFRGEL